MAKLTDAHKRFLAQPFVAVVTTLREDGSPHNTVVWVEALGDDVSFNTAYPRRKPRHLEHDPRAALTVVDPDDAFRWLSVSGPVELTTDGAIEQIDRLSEKYRGVRPYAGHNDRETRVTVAIHPERITAYGLD